MCFDILWPNTHYYCGSGTHDSSHKLAVGSQDTPGASSLCDNNFYTIFLLHWEETSRVRMDLGVFEYPEQYPQAIYSSCLFVTFAGRCGPFPYNVV